MAARRRSSAGERAAGRYHHGDLRRALVEAAIEELATCDPRDLSLRQLARRVGVSTAAPYRHFPSRDALLAAVAEEGFRGLAEALERALADVPPDPLVRLREAGVAYVGFAHRHPSHYRVMFGKELFDRSTFPSLAEAAATSMAVLMETIEQGLADGLLRRADPRELAVAAWSVVHGLASLLGSGQLALFGVDPEDPETIARTVARALIDGVVAPEVTRASGTGR